MFHFYFVAIKMEKIIQELEEKGFIMALEYTGQCWNGKCGNHYIEGKDSKEEIQKALIEKLCGEKI